MIPSPEVGQRFGRLVVVANGEMCGRDRAARLLCDCGTTTKVSLSSLRHGVTKSCGCFRREHSRDAATKHGHLVGGFGTPEYATWLGMVGRCKFSGNGSFAKYGARGVAVCDEWRSDFPAFLAHVGPKPSPKHTIDRIDNSRGYEPGNVRWATQTEQQRNRTNNRVIVHNGVARCLAEWASVTGIKRETIAMRLRKGWSAADALSRPVRAKADQRETA